MTDDTGFDDLLDGEAGVPADEGESWGDLAERLRTPDTLADLHELPWSAIEGAFVRVVVEVDNGFLDREGTDDTTTRLREGELVGRGEGTGLYYDPEVKDLIPNPIGPAIFLDTPEDTVLEVRTGKPGTELLAFDAGGEGGE